MGRKAIDYDLDKVIDQICFVESNYPQSSRSGLYAKVGELLGYSPSFVMGLINKHNIPLTTPLGKKGREKGSVVQKSEAPKDIDPVAVLSGNVKPRKRGSMKAAIRQNCFNCCGTPWGKKPASEARLSVRNCHITECALHPFRPLKTPEEKAEKAARFALTVLDSPPNSVNMVVSEQSEPEETPSVLVPDTTVWDYEN